MEDQIFPATSSTVSRRLHALKNFSLRASEEIQLGSLFWDESNADLRALTINNCIRRQRDSIAGAIALGEAGQGHLGVAFVRAFFEERVWVTFLASMTKIEANDLLLAMGQWDVVRSLIAQRDYIGDLDMTVHLWYPPGFVDAQAALLPKIKAELNRLRAKWGWRGTLPSPEWVANEVSLGREYEYLHPATSRALHFSSGEVLRRGWGTPGGVLTTEKGEFQGHLAEFAFDQLWRQHLGTLVGASGVLAEAAIVVGDTFFLDENQKELTSELLNFGQVPLVHAHEWNLNPPPPGIRIAWAVVMLAQSAESESRAAGDAGSQ